MAPSLLCGVPFSVVDAHILALLTPYDAHRLARTCRAYARLVRHLSGQGRAARDAIQAVRDGAARYMMALMCHTLRVPVTPHRNVAILDRGITLKHWCDPVRCMYWSPLPSCPGQITFQVHATTRAHYINDINDTRQCVSSLLRYVERCVHQLMPRDEETMTAASCDFGQLHISMASRHVSTGLASLDAVRKHVDAHGDACFGYVSAFVALVKRNEAHLLRDALVDARQACRTTCERHPNGCSLPSLAWVDRWSADMTRIIDAAGDTALERGKPLPAYAVCRRFLL